ncbi:MAG: arsenosugar biosynthesis radical SAM protein ArsS [Planctomycetes bacterium]|nr:arsenosugar biosynthesis radical SAM protein ArsS [Planctomycetota bacterium]
MECGGWPLHATELTTLQVNLGKLCNQACRHCHVDAGPHRTDAADNMGRELADEVLRVLGLGGFHTLDLTGGAPELNPEFRRIVREARELGVHVMDRCNLTILGEPGQEDLGAFLAEHRVEITASLPHYSALATDRQRGGGVFDASVRGLLALNELGYGRGDGLVLNLVYNPAGAFLPGDQAALEADFKQQLDRRFGIRFDRLFCITNMPIRRYLEWLERSGNRERYLRTLLDAFNPAALPGLMCRNLISVGPDGTLYDCDFNQMLELRTDASAPRHLREFDRRALETRRIVTGEHCLGCTAGAGSSCGGTVA